MSLPVSSALPKTQRRSSAESSLKQLLVGGSLLCYSPWTVVPGQCPGHSQPSTHGCPHRACFCLPKGEQGVTLIPAEASVLGATALMVSCRWMELSVRAVLGMLMPAGQCEQDAAVGHVWSPAVYVLLDDQPSRCHRGKL